MPLARPHLLHTDAVRSWRRSCAADPLTTAAGLLVWGLTVWWLVPAFTEAPGSIIVRILDLSVSLTVVREVLVVLVVLQAAGLFACRPWLTRAAAAVGLAWWAFVWILLVESQPMSTSTGSYALVLALAVIYLLGVTRNPPRCAA